LSQNNQKGFTVIELLVVFVIFSFLIASAYLATSMYLNTVVKSQNHKEHAYQLVSSVTLLDKSIKAMSDYYVETKSYVGKMMVPYVKGSSTELSYVSHFSIFGFDTDVAVKVQLTESGTQLEVSEYPLNLGFIKKMQDEIPFTTHKILITFEQPMSFSYLHREPFNQDMNLKEVTSDYVSEFQSLVERGLPKTIKLNSNEDNYSFIFTPVTLNSKKAIMINTWYQGIEG